MIFCYFGHTKKRKKRKQKEKAEIIWRKFIFVNKMKFIFFHKNSISPIPSYIFRLCARKERQRRNVNTQNKHQGGKEKFKQV